MTLYSPSMSGMAYRIADHGDHRVLTIGDRAVAPPMARTGGWR